MYVIKRDGRKEKASLDKTTARIEELSSDLNVDPIMVAQKVVAGLYDGIYTSEIDNFLAETAAMMIIDHPDYSILASRIAISSLHKETKGFLDSTEKLYQQGTLSKSYYDLVKANGKAYESLIDYKRDFDFEYFGFKTLERSYLIKYKGFSYERPQDMYLRVAITVAGDDSIEKVKEIYDLMSQGYYTHATPTLFNSGTTLQQLSSCFLLGIEDDSIEGIFNTLKETAIISKTAGGIGIHVHNVRATGSPIKGTNGISNGIIPMLKVFNETARYVDQGGGKRKGSFAVYIEPWHFDIEAFLDLKKNHGKEEFRARDLFLALWVPDLFMKRVEEGGDWTLMSESDCPGLSDVYGDDFEKLYTRYELEGKGKKVIPAQHLMTKIIESQSETGVPYMLYKDACNSKSNQKNIGTIKSSNLCAEVIEYSDGNETAVCNLASIALPMFVDGDKYDFESLHRVAKVVTKNLDKIIDKNFYPTEKTYRSNNNNRPIGVGVQGLADVFFKLRLPYDSQEARALNKEIFETIYHAGMEASMEISREKGPYRNFEGSPISQGIFQFQMWGVEPSKRYDWDKLRKDIKEYGVRNSLITSLMPTASTAQILGNTEAFEIQTSNIYKRQTLSGEFLMVNKYLIRELKNIGIWSNDMRAKIIINNGSVQSINEIPDDIKEIYKTVWEMSQRVVIDMSADRAPFICQSQSMNLWLSSPSLKQVYSMHMYAWKKGLKTGMYYLRTKPSVNAVKVTLKDESVLRNVEDVEDCIMCGS
ncbi:ribonucleoside-diphosphate reductase subunit alpha [Ichthyobacterium seriolicida]|uniref:Ribonucleoside-diphosphate reductase n=1 Tax=Ichthyobacterium seriolicida TaxID=242600 RepID=A0A1J1E9S4_9FLAO|nr:ribonucleoside-diphosphate reductase subunit alpha [Ichthyobacterium seriolicida]BAV94280.1 ribonucleotide reductase of class Ia, alpha subunit [Ichthyobacterium seriolicida]